MAEIISQVGTGGGRDYSTYTAWEADWDNGTIYSAGDDAIGEGFDDSAFDENFSGNGGSTIGLNSARLTVAAGQRHDGTEGTGVRIVRTAAGIPILMDAVGVADKRVEWIEVDANDTAGIDFGIISRAGSGPISRVLVHGITNNGAGGSVGIQVDIGNHDIVDSIVYDLENTRNNGIARGINSAGSAVSRILNCTVDNLAADSGAGAAVRGIFINDAASNEVRNCIATTLSAAGGGSTACFAPASPATTVMDHNMSSDTTASGTGSLTNQSASNEFTNLTAGSEDYHLKTGANAIAAGVDLGTTPLGVEFDIDNGDRDLHDVTWDMGADQFGLDENTPLGGGERVQHRLHELSLGM